MSGVSAKEHAMDRIMMQLSELIIIIQSVNEKRGQPAVLKSFQQYLQGVFSRAVQSDPREPRPSLLVQKVSGILARAIKRIERIDDRFDQSGSWKDVQEVDAFKALMKDLKMYIQMLNLAPFEDHSAALPVLHADSAPLDRSNASPATTRTRSPATVSPNPTPRSSSPRRGRPATAMTASAIGAKMARRERERELSLAAAQLAPPVQPLHPAAPEDRPPQPAAALPSTLPHGLVQDLEATQDSTVAEAAMHARPANPGALESASSHPATAPAVALREYADVADLPFVPTVAKRSNPATVSDSDGASSLAPPGTSRAVMEIREAASRALSMQQAAAASLAAARSARDAFSAEASTPEGSGHGPCVLSSRNAPGTLGDGDSAPCLCSSPRGAEQLFLHKSPSHAVGGRTAAAPKASPDALAAARQSYAIDHAAAALPRRPGTAAAAPASGTSAGTAASAATAPADLAAAAAALQPAPPRNGLQPQPVSRPAPGSISPPILYGKVPGPPSATPGSPVNHQSSAASGSTSASSGHKLPAYRLRAQPPAAPASPSRLGGARAPSQLRALDDLSNKFATASVSGSAMSATAMSATGAMAGLASGGKGGVSEPRITPPPAPGCSLASIFCRGTAPKD